MGMSYHRLPAFALAAFCALAIMPMAAVGVAEDLPDGERYERRRRGKGQNNRRGKGIQAKPRRRSNRLLISKRVRRKHRRAA